jgi:hypothetical protein
MEVIMKKILFAILLLAFATTIFGYTFEVTSNAAGTCAITLMYNNSPLPGGYGILTFTSAGTQSISITPSSGVPDKAKIDGQSAITQPCQFTDQFFFSPVRPPMHVNYVEIDIDGIEKPDPGTGGNTND